MYPITVALKERFESGERKKTWITLNNAGTDPIVITEEDIKADSFSIDRYCATGNKIEIGSAVSSEFSVVLNNSDGKFDGIVFEGSVLCVDVGFEHTKDNYVRCGFFTVDEPPRAFSTISLKALDYMMLYDKTIDRTKLTKAFYTPEELVRRISELCEVEISDLIKFSQLPNADQSLSIPATATTYRQLLQWVAGITGTCAYIDWDGKLRMSWFVDSGVNITPSLRYSGNVHESDIEITGVTVKTQEATYTDGSEKYPLVVEGNGFVYSGTEEHRATTIGSVVNGFTYRPYECTCLPMPYLFPLDGITYTDKSGNVISTVVTNHTFGLNSTSSLAAQGESQQKKGYAGQRGLTKAEVDSAIAEAMKNFDSSTEHFYVMYSAYEKGIDADGKASMFDKVQPDTAYLGTCATNSKNPPEDPEDYNWVRIRGGDGESPLSLKTSPEVMFIPVSTDGLVEEELSIEINAVAYEGSTLLADIVLTFEDKPVGWGYQFTNSGMRFTIPKGWSSVASRVNSLTALLYNDMTGVILGKLTVPVVYVRSGEAGRSLQVKYLNSATAPVIANNDVTGWSDTVPAPEKGKRTYMTQKLSSEANWSTPIQISAEDGTTPTVSINSSGYWVINGDTTSVKAQGENGDTPTITVGANGNWFVDGKDTGTKAQGAQGKDGANIEYVYYRSQNAVANLAKPTYTSGKLPSGWETSPQGITETYKYEYVSVRTKAAGSTVWSEFSTPVIWSKWGEKGTDGDGIEYKYYLCNSPSKPSYSAGDAKWTDEPTGVSATNMYEYVVQITHRGDGTADSVSEVALWSKWGETGDAGVSVVEVITEYHKSTSDTTAPATNSSGWTTEAPLWEDGCYLWTRLKTVFSEGSPKYSTPVVDASWKKVTAVESASKELNETLAGALGLHLTEQKLATSTVRYYHTNPKLENSKSGDTILVLNDQGFGVCKNGWNNGNPQFTYGTTFDGKAVWDILTANKINADLVEAGKLKSTNNASVNTVLNLDSGEMSFKSDGQQILVRGKIDDESGEIPKELLSIDISKWTGAGIAMDDSNTGEGAFFCSSGVMLIRDEFLTDSIKWVRAYLEWMLDNSKPYPGSAPKEAYVDIRRELLFSTNIKCDNLSFSPDGGNNHVNMADLYSNFVSAQEALSAMQEKIAELEEKLDVEHEHIYTTEVSVSPTCTDNGERLYKCGCGYSYTTTIAALGHEYTSVVTPPTTTAQGYTTHTCTRCGDSYKDNYTEADTGSDEDTITVGVTKTVDIVQCSTSDLNDSTPAADLTFVKFIPTVTGTYQFEATGGTHTDTIACLFDSTKTVQLIRDDDSGTGAHFLFTNDCEAGETYYIAVKWWQTTAVPGTADLLVTLLSSSGGSSSGGSSGGDGMTIKVSSVDATVNDKIQIYECYEDSQGVWQPDFSKPLGTSTILTTEGQTVYTYAEPGSGRKITKGVPIVDGVVGDEVPIDTTNAFGGKMNYVSGCNTYEIKIYFAQA